MTFGDYIAMDRFADDDIRSLVESAETEEPRRPLRDRVNCLLEACVDDFENALRDRSTDMETRISIATCLVEIASLPDELTEEEIFQQTGSYAGTTE